VLFIEESSLAGTDSKILSREVHDELFEEGGLSSRLPKTATNGSLSIFALNLANSSEYWFSNGRVREGSSFLGSWTSACSREDDDAFSPSINRRLIQWPGTRHPHCGWAASLSHRAPRRNAFEYLYLIIFCSRCSLVCKCSSRYVDHSLPRRHHHHKPLDCGGKIRRGRVMVDLTVRRLALQEHLALDTRSLVMEARWMLETCMLAVVQSIPVYRCLKVVCIGGTPVGVNRIVTVPTPRS
jgi:hypothetical protein